MVRKSYEIYLRDGDWRITKFTYPDGSYLYIEHYCTAGRGRAITKGWVGMHYNYASMSKPCYVCSKVPPDGLQGLFAMLIW